MSRLNLNEIEDYLDDDYEVENFKPIRSERIREDSSGGINSDQKRRNIKMKRVLKEEQRNY